MQYNPPLFFLNESSTINYSLNLEVILFLFFPFTNIYFQLVKGRSKSPSFVFIFSPPLKFKQMEDHVFQIKSIWGGELSLLKEHLLSSTMWKWIQWWIPLEFPAMIWKIIIVLLLVCLILTSIIKCLKLSTLKVYQTEPQSLFSFPRERLFLGGQPNG